MKQAFAPLMAVRRFGSGLLLHTYQDSEIAAQARPGQFVNVRVSGATAPLLRRPFSICDAHPETGRFTVLFQVVGEGTEALARAGAGDAIDIVGPLGSSFPVAQASQPVGNDLQTSPVAQAFQPVRQGPHTSPVAQASQSVRQGPHAPPAPATALLVAGGVGVAPLHFLAAQARRLRKAGPEGPRVVFAYGARDSNGLALSDEIERRVDELLISTEDGSRGRKGLVTDLLDPYLDAGCEVYCCGPRPMMAAVLRLMRQRGIEKGWFSLENQMGCGVGVCLGCVVPTRRGYLRVCHDGPVLPAPILDFE